MYTSRSCLLMPVGAGKRGLGLRPMPWLVELVMRPGDFVSTVRYQLFATSGQMAGLERALAGIDVRVLLSYHRDALLVSLKSYVETKSAFQETTPR
jgi:hypothetical protein